MIPDPTELADAAAERYLDEHGGEVACCKCGAVCDAGSAWPMAWNPSAPPICGKCLFVCAKCGKETPVAPLSGPAYCEECCPDHDYRYDRGRRGHFCITCDMPRPDDWSFDD